MSDEVEPQRRRRWWPQTVRVRLTIVATLVFAIAISAAAFGLVRLVHNNLLDRIQETNQHQLNELAAAIQRGDVQPPSQPNTVCGYDFRGRPVCYSTLPSQRDGYEAAQREIRTTAGNITLVAQQSTEEVNRTVDSVSTVLLFAVPGMIALVALAAWYFAGRALRPVEAIRLEAESITGATMHRRVPVHRRVG